MKIKDNIVTLETLKHDVKINKEKVTVDPLQLFSRLLVIVEREYDMKQYLKYELTTIPTSLLKRIWLDIQISQILQSDQEWNHSKQDSG